MHSVKEIFRIGRGPSSSHTMGPEKACHYMLSHFPEADEYRVTLFGSLSKTGKGHRTDYVIEQTLSPYPCRILWDRETTSLPHPNTLDIVALKDGKELATQRFLSIGGGAIEILGQPSINSEDVYPENTLKEVMEVCRERGLSLSQYVFANEGREIHKHLHEVMRQMEATIKHGLTQEGVLPGGLNVTRRAKQLIEAGLRDRNLLKKQEFLISAYSYASCEENATGEKMVTAPTCGACGVLPAVLYYEATLFGSTDEEIINALAVAGLLGCLIKQNASISGAECGCQAEIGSACSMAAGAIAFLHGLSMEQIECAAEIAMESCLGLTCDPIGGLVQIPCIERNAVAALRSYNAATLAEVVYDSHKISFDMVVRTMYETGKDLSACYRETAEGGLAKLYVKDFY